MGLGVRLLAISLLLAPLAAAAQDSGRADLRELYVKSGLEKQVRQIPLLAQQAFDQAVAADPEAGNLPKELTSALRRAIGEVFAPARTKEIVLRTLEDRLPREDAAAALRWLDSPLGARCTELEEAASTPAGYEEMQRFVRRLEDTPPTPQRLNVLQSLDDAVGATEANVAIALGMQVAIAAGFLALLPPEQQVPPEMLLAEAERARPAMEEALSRQVMASFLYTYRTLTVPELEAYFAYASSPAGVSYHAASLAGLRTALLESAVNLGAALKTAIEDAQIRVPL